MEKTTPVSPDTESCPECGADWRGGEIPADQREVFGGRTHFSRLVAVYSLALDRTTGYECPNCRANWVR